MHRTSKNIKLYHRYYKSNENFSFINSVSIMHERNPHIDEVFTVLVKS